MTAMIAPRRAALPLWMKVCFTLFVGILVPIYWRDYGPANFLWFCDLGLLVSLLGLWLDSPLLIGMQAIALALPQAIWIADFLTGGHLIGISAYMFNPVIPLLTRALSTFHIWLPILLIYSVWRMGYDRRAVWAQSLLAAAVLIASFLFTDPRHPPTRYPAAAVNVNRVYGIHAADVQNWMPWYCFLGLHILFWPLVFYLPTHLIFRRLFRRPAGTEPPPSHSEPNPTTAPRKSGDEVNIKSPSAADTM
jgi:hypothetical protein